MSLTELYRDLTDERLTPIDVVFWFSLGLACGGGIVWMLGTSW